MLVPRKVAPSGFRRRILGSGYGPDTTRDQSCSFSGGCFVAGRHLCSGIEPAEVFKPTSIALPPSTERGGSAKACCQLAM